MTQQPYTVDGHPATLEHVREVVIANAESLAELVLGHLPLLGARSEWDMDQNFELTEAVARWADSIGLPDVGNQSDEALRYWGIVAVEQGFEPSDVDVYDVDEA